MYQPRTRRGSVILPLVLIGLGGLFLLINLGLVSQDVWASLWKLWPVLLILLGIEVILGGRISGGLVVLLVVAAMLAVVVAGAALFIPFSRTAPTPAQSQATQISELVQEVGSARRADVRLSYTAGSFSVGPGAAPGRLVEGIFQGDDSLQVEKSYRVQGDTGVLDLRLTGRRAFALPGSRDEWPGRLDLRLASDLPLTLDVQAGAADGTLDLTDLQVTSLKLDSGAARTTVRFPRNAGRTTAEVKGGATQLRLVIPPGVAARIDTEGGLASVRVDEQRFPKTGSVFQSADYATAANRLDLTVRVGLASVTVE